MTPEQNDAPISGDMTAGVAAVIEAAKERWQRGARDFQRLLRTDMKSHRPGAKIIRSAVYGDMRFSAEEMLFVESFYLQRLRRISQMGLMHLVYPDARHSRFEHSLGVLHSLKALLEADPQVRESLDDRTRRTLYFAAMLHDCGHGPFSHTTETLLEIAGLDIQMRPFSPGDSQKLKPHEKRGRSMILDTDFHLENLNLETYGLSQALQSVGKVDPDLVARLVVGSEPSPLVNLLSGDFDVDKMDYFRRDAFFTGTRGGGVEMEALQRWIRVYKAGDYPRASFDRKAVGHVLHMLYSREHVYFITAFHPVARIVAALLLVAGDVALRVLPPEASGLLYANIELLDDQELLSILQMVGRGAVDDAELETERRLLQRIVERIYLRRLPKRLCTLTRGEFLESFSSCIPALEHVSGTLPHLAYCRISKIAGGKYLKFLRDSDDSDDVAILDLSPPLGRAEESTLNTLREREMLGRISVYVDVTKQPSPLDKWLNQHAGAGAAEAHAAALRAYKLGLWRALVLVPASIRISLHGDEKMREDFLVDFSVALENPESRLPTLLDPRHSRGVAQVNRVVTSWQESRNAKGQLEAQRIARRQQAKRDAGSV